MKRQKITVICNDRFPSAIAHGVYLARLCESLSLVGASVELIVPKRFREVSSDPFEYYDIKSRFKIIKIWSFDFIIFAKYFPRIAYWAQYANFYLFTIGYLLFRSRNRVIYTMDYFGPVLTALGFTVVFEAHQWNERYSGFLKSVLRLSRGVVVTNSFIGKRFQEIGFLNTGILVAQNGVNLNRFTVSTSQDSVRSRLGLPSGRKMISYIGKYRTLGAEKGVKELIDAVAQVSIKHPSAFLLLVGMDIDEKKEVELLCEASGLKPDSYSVVTLVPQKQVVEYLASSDIFVMNYPRTNHYSYNMSPMKMFEYMASSRPIVTTDLPAIREVLDENTAVFVSPDDRASLEEGLEKLLNDDKLGERLATNAYTRVAEFTWEKRAERILDFISRTV